MLSVVAASVILFVGVMLARPMIRDSMLQQMIRVADLDACMVAPEDWGSAPGSGFSVYAYDRSGHSANPEAPSVEPELLRRALRTRGVASDYGATPYVVSVLQAAPDGPCAVVRLRNRLPSNNLPLLGRFAAVIATTTLLGMLVAGLGTFGFVVRPLQARVEALSVAARGVGSDGFAAPRPSPDALGHIAEVLAESHDRIVEGRDALVARNRALEDHLAGIAHDLRTPLASMQLSLESLASEADGSLRQEARRALSDVVYLTSLVENLHQGTRLRHAVDVAEGRINLAELVRRLEKRFAIVGRHADVEVAANVPEGAVWAACQPSLAERALANLIHNAVEHNPGQGHVAIVLSTTDDGGFDLLVIDDGPGLPDDMRATLDEEAFLVDAARRRGPGLGMLITAEVARRAGWTLTYEPLAPTGLQARVRGPTVPAL